MATRRNTNRLTLGPRYLLSLVDLLGKSSIDCTDDGENITPRWLRKPSLASSSAISPSDRWCPFGDRRRSLFASCTSSGLISAHGILAHVVVVTVRGKDEARRFIVVKSFFLFLKFMLRCTTY
jgi:hypothetical protein